MYMDILLKLPLYVIATNPYIVPNIPMIFGKFPGDEYYTLMKQVFFFLIMTIITYGIFASHNSNLANDPSKSEEMKNIAKNWKTSLSDTVLVMFVVLLLYFLISMFFMPVQLIKIQFEEVFNSFFFVIAFGIIALIYALITDNLAFAKDPNDIKTNIFSIGIVVLLVLFVLFDGQLSGGIPGLNLIPPQLRKLMNLALKINGLSTGDNPQFLKEITAKLTASGKVQGADVNKLIRLSGSALKSMPPIASEFIKNIKNQTKLLDKLLGPVDLGNVKQISDFIGNPLIKIMLGLIPV